MKIGYIVDRGLSAADGIRFKLVEASCTRRISSKSDRVYSKILVTPVDYDEVFDNTQMMKQNKGMILVREPLFMDSELRDRIVTWVDWANKVSPSEYDPFYTEESGT